VRCPQCGTENSPDNRFCGNCGKGLDEPVMEAPLQRPPRVRRVRTLQNLSATNHRRPHRPIRAASSIWVRLRTGHRATSTICWKTMSLAPQGAGDRNCALALVAGLGYLRWRNGGLAFLNLVKSGTKTATQTAEPAPAPADQVLHRPSRPRRLRILSRLTRE